MSRAVENGAGFEELRSSASRTPSPAVKPRGTIRVRVLLMARPVRWAAERKRGARGLQVAGEVDGRFRRLRPVDRKGLQDRLAVGGQRKQREDQEGSAVDGPHGDARSFRWECRNSSTLLGR